MATKQERSDLHRKSTIKALIEAKNSGKKVAAIDFVSTNPEIPAIISKLVKANYPISYDSAGMRQIDTVDVSTMKQASDEIIKKNRDADTVMELFPEMELSAQILISSIISPKDMNTTEVNFTLPDNLKVSVLANSLLPIVEDYFNTIYKIEPLLPRMLEDILFRTGSYPIMVIPENSVDDIINDNTNLTTESIKIFTDDKGRFKNLGLLGPAVQNTNTNFSLESISNFGRDHSGYDGDIYIHDGFKKIKVEHLSVTDNFNVLKMPKIVAKARQQAVSNILGTQSVALEDFQKYHIGGFRTDRLNDEQLAGLFYKNNFKPFKTIIKVKTDAENERSTIGEPLVLKLPSEAVLPVYTPGNEELHIGYFILIDSEGNPVNKNSVLANESDLRARLGINSDMTSYLLNRAASNYYKDCSTVTFRQASKIYADLIESDLLARLRNGIVGPVVSIAKNEEVYRIMLARVLMKQNTQLLYVPKELFTYIAIKFNDYGVGVSLLDKMRNLNSLRAMLLFSKTMAQVKNSIGRTKVQIKLDPADPNPQKTIETVMHEVARTRQQGFPLGINTAGDLVDWIQKSGIEYGFEGHPGLPDTGIEFSEFNTNYTEPNNDLSDDLRKAAIMATGLSPETVDNGFNSEFATTVVANNILLSKRVQKIQEAFVPLVTDHCRKVVLHNAYIVDKVKEVIKDNLKKITEAENVDPIVERYNNSNPDLLIHLLTLEFLSNFEVSLSRPDTVTIKNLAEAFDIQEQMVDKAINYYISSDIFPESMTGEEASQRVDEIKNIVKAYFMRKWFAENHVLPEMLDLGAVDEDGQPVVDFGKEHHRHINAMTKSIVSLLSKTMPVAKAADRDVQKLAEDLNMETPDAAVSSSSDSGSDEGGDDFGGGDFGGDEDPFGGMDMDMDMGGEESEESTEESSETTETTTNADGTTTTTTTSSSSSSSSSSGGF